MSRVVVVEFLDGNHPRWGRAPTLVLHGLILLSAIAIAVETVPGLPPRMVSALNRFEAFILLLFVTEYILRLTCSPQPLRYAFSVWGIIDLLSCVPAIALLEPEWQAFRSLRLLRLLKLFHTSVALDRLGRALYHVRGELFLFGILSAFMLYVSAVGIYFFEHAAQPEAFASIPQSLWWAVASFTTVGYGDLYPITMGGRLFASIVLFIGLGIVAVPSAIITAALMDTKGDGAGDTSEQKPETTKKGDQNETS